MLLNVKMVLVRHGDEYYLPTSNDYYIEAVESCDAYFINEQAYILEDDAEKDCS